MDIVILFMRVANRTWSANDIVDVFPIDKDPGAGVAITPKHALMIVRNVPVDDARGFARVKNLLTQKNLLVDTVPERDKGDGALLDKRRWSFVRSELPTARRDTIRNKGRLEIDWVDLSLVVSRKRQGVIDARRVRVSDLDG